MTLSSVGGAVRRWWFPRLPLARVGVLRFVLYWFVLYDIFVLTHDVIGHAHSPQLFRPTLLGRLIGYEPHPWLALTLQWLLVVTCVVTPVLLASRRRPLQVAGRTTAWVAGLAFAVWMLDSQGFGYVSHDHMALFLALLLLPTVPAAPVRSRADGTWAAGEVTPLAPGAGASEPVPDGVRLAGTVPLAAVERAGWALRCIQVAVVMTYFGSALAKAVATGGFTHWPNSSVFAWAVLRRGTPLVSWVVDHPALLHVAQWALYLVEWLSPVVLWLRGRVLYLTVLVFCLFHLMTWLALGIHFLPTVVCWLAFLPLERLAARWGTRGRR